MIREFLLGAPPGGSSWGLLLGAPLGGSSWKLLLGIETRTKTPSNPPATPATSATMGATGKTIGHPIGGFPGWPAGGKISVGREGGREGEGGRGREREKERGREREGGRASLVRVVPDPIQCHCGSERLGSGPHLGSGFREQWVDRRRESVLLQNKLLPRRRWRRRKRL